MVSFSAAAASFLAFLASSTSAGVATATTTTSRRLAYELIAGYEPKSQVTDQNAIDLDQEAMEEQLALATWESYIAALAIYTQGAHSESVAEVALATPLSGAIQKGTRVLGLSADGDEVVGKAYEDYASGATNLVVQYQTSDSQNNYVDCQVGASLSPNTDGCYAATGSFEIDGVGDYTYSYDPLTNNVNKRTIAGFSTSAQEKMANCDGGCPYPMYQKFQEYYGAYDYANQIILAAFSGSKTNLNNFNNDFSLYDYAGKEQIIKKGTVYMAIFMFVIHELEDAINDCKEGRENPAHSWDKAAAYYTGSLEGTDGAGSGKLLYALADKRCSNYKTCGDLADEKTGTAHVNIEIFKQLDIGLGKIVQGECDSAREQMEIIETLMLIPQVQGALRYAYKTANEGYSEKAEAEGVIFAAAVLPAVHACDPAAAETIADNVVAGQQGTCNFPEVKSAFESTLACMGINPDYVGGLYDGATGEYMEGAEPMAVMEGATPLPPSESGYVGYVAGEAGAAAGAGVAGMNFFVVGAIAALSSLFMLV